MNNIIADSKYYLSLMLLSLPAYAHPPYIEPYKSWLVIGVAVILSVTTFILLKKINIVVRLVVSAAIFAAAFYGGGFVVLITSF